MLIWSLLLPLLLILALAGQKFVRGTAEGAVQNCGAGISKGRTVVISGRYPAALYVLDKQLQRLHEEAIETERRLEHLRQRELAAT